MRLQRGLSRTSVIEGLSRTPQAVSMRTLMRIESGQLVPATDVTWALLKMYGGLTRLQELFEQLALDNRRTSR
jgi:hypothetical protein